MEANGDNTTKLKHMQKAKLRKEGKLPVSTTCKQDLIENSRKFLEHHCHVVEKAARIAREKKKTTEDMIEEKRFEAALRKEEKIMEAKAKKVATATKRAATKVAQAKKAEAKKAYAEAKDTVAETKKEVAKAKKEASAKAKKEAAAAAKAKKPDERANKRLAIAERRHAKKSCVED